MNFVQMCCIPPALVPGSTTVRVPDGGSDGYEVISTGGVSIAGNDYYVVRRDLYLSYTRFLPIIPVSASILTAKVTFVSRGNETGAVTGAIQAADMADALALAGVPNEISSLARTSASVPWPFTNWGWLYESYASPDISSVIQELVNSYGAYDGTRGLALILSGSGAGLRRACSKNWGLNREATLTITYES